jgi:hypothetical protein
LLRKSFDIIDRNACPRKYKTVMCNISVAHKFSAARWLLRLICSRMFSDATFRGI